MSITLNKISEQKETYIEAVFCLRNNLYIHFEIPDFEIPISILIDQAKYTSAKIISNGWKKQLHRDYDVEMVECL